MKKNKDLIEIEKLKKFQRELADLFEDIYGEKYKYHKNEEWYEFDLTHREMAKKIEYGSDEIQRFLKKINLKDPNQPKQRKFAIAIRVAKSVIKAKKEFNLDINKYRQQKTQIENFQKEITELQALIPKETKKTNLDKLAEGIEGFSKLLFNGAIIGFVLGSVISIRIFDNPSLISKSLRDVKEAILYFKPNHLKDNQLEYLLEVYGEDLTQSYLENSIIYHDDLLKRDSLDTQIDTTEERNHIRREIKAIQQNKRDNLEKVDFKTMLGIPVVGLIECIAKKDTNATNIIQNIENLLLEKTTSKEFIDKRIRSHIRDGMRSQREAIMNLVTNRDSISIYVECIFGKEQK